MKNFFRVLLAASFACGAFCAFGGTATYSFLWYRNAAQADFQVPVALEEGVNGFTYADAAADGADLCVTDAGGTQLPVEIENWNPSGKSIVWVKVPSFSKDSVLTFLWGADAAGLTPLRDHLWGNDARLVMHLADGKDSSTYNAAFVRGGDDATDDGPEQIHDLLLAQFREPGQDRVGYRRQRASVRRHGAERAVRHSALIGPNE